MERIKRKKIKPQLLNAKIVLKREERTQINSVNLVTYKKWWARKELNFLPPAYKTDALTDELLALEIGGKLESRTPEQFPTLLGLANQCNHHDY